ncbi:phosphate ABC transporter, inner membrane subunit PstC [Desulfofarcimen acetoxidans DSM 771]|jgi:phosphate transport system permease protein|uniref:Phosphate transport system permease protein n=1 Tax=Desulfofarcimen acetoxidans (strain ATCC 49208 / DSM 771 / KCTC 5769 / VKM B-1644 / 5575) TaxID=485916 RepID=C8W4B2_DESAS|nr:phosphate ABC transporter permease subunit PstC [Desulfofarcimen acetoxidans]ACV61980.1 phosphate ABC transporter, inner membrane subunit PstC [Desulfofarcimen acetoxidans DSM 771]
MNRLHERLVQKIFLLSAVTGIFIIFLILFFIFGEGLPVLQKYGLTHFIFNNTWHPTKNEFGLLSMILGSFYVTLGALLLGVPISIGCAIYMAEIAPNWFSKAVRPLIELLAGIPSVVYGFYGLVVIVPLIMNYLGGRGLSMLAASFVLGMMILPTVINVSEDAIRAVPREYREGSCALGAGLWQTIYKVVLPTARPGIIAAVVLGMGRAVGETMAVILVAGNATAIPGSPLGMVRTLTGNIAIEMGYAAGDHAKALFATGIILIIIIMFLNTMISLIPGKAGGK